MAFLQLLNWLYIYIPDILVLLSDPSFRVSEDMPLYDILNEFQKGHSHIAVVYKDLNEKKDTSKKGKESEQLEFKDSCRKHRGSSKASPDQGEDLGSRNRRMPYIFYPIFVTETFLRFRSF